MTYPLGDIMERIRVDLNAVLPADLPNARASDASWHSGRKWIFTTRRPPSYVWFPGDIVADGPFKGDLGQFIAVETGAEVVNVHSWGGDQEATWTLRHNLISSAKNIFGADCRYLGCQWVEEIEGGFGNGFVTRLSFRVPVIGERLAVVVPTGYQNTAYVTVNDVDTLVTTDIQEP